MEIQMISNKAELIAKLNDEFRENLSKGIVMLSQGIRLNSLDDVDEIIEKVQADNDFKRGNNPYGERNFGAIKFKERNIFWKIDYYNMELTFLSPDASDASRTIRVLTIMYAEEY